MTATLETPVQAAQTAAPSATTWQIDPAHTHAEFAVRHMMVATAKGRFADVSGTITLDESNPANSSVEATIPVASIDTKQSDRDAHLRSADFFDAENHPNLTFRSTRVEPRGENEFIAYGELTIRGITREVALEGEYLGTGKSPYGFTVAGFSARTKINRKDYGLNWNAALETGGVLVGDEVKISLEVEAIQQS
ncbi:MAG TPA: YceI family protein [Chloroflexota bacterium]|nr:YceI family protein [Chloroflexota bacterium]